MGLFTPDVTRGATLSKCGLYRYRLWRTWGPGDVVTFVMLNPSTADADNDDPTIRKCMGFARRWGCGSLQVVNLAAFRCTDPRGLYNTRYPVSEPAKPQENFKHLRDAIELAGTVVCAWGVPGGELPNAAEMLEVMMAKWPTKLRVLGFNKDGTPKHPLMVPYIAPPVPLIQ